MPARGKPHWQTGKKKLCLSGRGGKRPSFEIFQIPQLPSAPHQKMALCEAICPLAAVKEVSEFAFTQFIALTAGTSYRRDSLASPHSSLLMCTLTHTHSHSHRDTQEGNAASSMREPEQGKAAGRHASARPSTRAETQGMSSGMGLTHSWGGERLKVHKHIVAEEGRAFPIHPKC